ncbi:unknown protein [Oryza sativa Japonica Group]|uniref:Uncharacterized protein n=3 Tax=Oryza TaxID=4527 RepID=A0A979HLN9_ORYSJ|nr:uncharacterized protein LOC4324595 [Oryza sativa Japonica Group]KAF2951030.1 hypothetical protein DAI22_01g231900 [Oryza sativa Japonica Group]BAD52985.1 unknown protein [Oryza sativa Japonica Group]BAD53434.1 unknown protein [Oryza sativa Japonica Group]BAG90473.1 unnamed protein product [Oryza sativa Japonica Group]BAG95769.1 unnamed protein product [Oryza sativa Japonica Group]
MAAGSIVVDFPSMGAACCFSSLESLLRDSTSRFLAAVSAAPDPDLTNFRSLFSRVLNTYPDPPLEAVWFFSALSFHDNPGDLRSLLHLLSAFTASSRSAAKPLALLAPVVSELYHSAKPRREAEALVEAVLSYISICSSRAAPAAGDGAGAGADAGSLLPAFGELVKVWSVRHSRDRCPFQVLFPLVGEDARRELMREGCSVAFLAGAVVAEAFLLRLCLKVQGAAGASRAELQKELRIWAVSSISVFQNQQFFGVLLNMLVNPPLPVYSLLSADDEILVRDVLYDALILVDYSFINKGAGVDQADSSLLPLYVSRLLITHDAINDARSKGDQGRAMSFMNAFFTSNIPTYFAKCATSQVGFNQLSKPAAITPQALLKWLVDLEDKGFKVFGENVSRIRERLMYDEVKNGYQSRMTHSDADLFFIDKQSGGEVMDTRAGEDEEAVEMETADNAFMAAAQSMKAMANGMRKRKDCGAEDANVVKFVKYKVEDSSVKDYFLSANNGMSSGSEVENPQSDDEMEETD